MVNLNPADFPVVFQSDRSAKGMVVALIGIGKPLPFPTRLTWYCLTCAIDENALERRI